MLDLSTLSCDQAIQESNPLATLLGGILGNRSLLFRANLWQMLSLWWWLYRCTGGHVNYLCTVKSRIGVKIGGMASLFLRYLRGFALIPKFRKNKQKFKNWHFPLALRKAMYPTYLSVVTKIYEWFDSFWVLRAAATTLSSFGLLFLDPPGLVLI